VESRARAPQQGKSHATREWSKSSRHIAHDGAFGGASARAMTRVMKHQCRARAIVTTGFADAWDAYGRTRAVERAREHGVGHDARDGAGERAGARDGAMRRRIDAPTIDDIFVDIIDDFAPGRSRARCGGGYRAERRRGCRC
jgi:hypothetical protein